jgi:aminopeptidase Y
MRCFLSLVAVSSIAAAAVLQLPLTELADGQVVISASKELVSSKGLEGHITQKNLLKRAKELYKIAGLGVDEYNHPTRVIGSLGKLRTPSLLFPVLTSRSYRTHRYD